MHERRFVKLSTIIMRIISKSFEVSARKVTQSLQIKLTQQREKMFSEKSLVVVEALDFFKQATLASPQAAKETLV